jgi:hypothetical protein
VRQIKAVYFSLVMVGGLAVAADKTVLATAYITPGACAVATVEYNWHDDARDRDVPVKIYYPATNTAPCPVIIFSHGLGGFRAGYEYLGRHWAIPFDHMSGADNYLLILAGGDHMVFSGRRLLLGNRTKDDRLHELILMGSTAFWNAYLRSDAAAKAWLSGGGFKAAVGMDGTFDQKTATAAIPKPCGTSPCYACFLPTGAK